MMTIKKILTAAATVAVLSVAGASAAAADSWYGHDGYGYQDNRGNYDDNYRSGYDRDGDHNWRDRDYDNGWHRGWYGHDGWRYRHAHFYGRPFWYHGRYVVRTYDSFGRVSFVEVGPNGGVSGYFRF